MEPKKRIPRTGEPEPNVPPREDDAHATPLGRGARPGTTSEQRAVEGKGIAGPHGAQTPGAQGGPSGLVDRENEDAVPRSRRGNAGLDAEANDEGA